MRTADFWAVIFANAWQRQTSSWGYRSYYYKGVLVKDFHHGVDRASGKSNPVYPIEDAYVVKIGSDTSSGKFVYIWCAGVIHFYCHLASINVKVGQTIGKNTIIGMTGTTGHSTGIHLHFGIRKSLSTDWINPDGWITNYQPTTVKTRYVNATRGLNVRTGPSVLSTKITALGNDREVKVYMTYGTWSYIRTTDGKVAGWVSTEYLSITR